jgi:two-component system LytT family response regulator
VKISALVVDDEPLAQRKLAALIADVPWAEQIGTASDGVAALKMIELLHPDVVFLDIQMPEISGIEVLERLCTTQPAPSVIFTTAYNHYAVAAFELQAVDYLLKPFGARRFLVALERARYVVQMHASAQVLERARAVLAAPKGSLSSDRIFVRDGNSVLPLALDEVERIAAEDDYVMIHTPRRSHLVSLRISELEERLPSPPFMRIHRSHIVNLNYVERIAGLDDSRLEVRLKSGAVVAASRARSQQLRRLAR